MLSVEHQSLRYRKRPISTLSPSQMDAYLREHKKLQALKHAHEQALKKRARMMPKLTALRRKLGFLHHHVSKLERDLKTQEHKFWNASQGIK